ncbi:CoA-transferase family III [Aspergillus homomorphus CBS 101889]|uniref:CoA-transferase family III n=1 Tax=Aspergillus homomorphus (strain CBS 101889) TaxID=1450537 RepID=A0A395HU79_ASPHC|nr:CoA-transferase family III [Aspergillus homomorphus CBS 101889]RAL10945.1 CoA-transferase family III [Aspergillus homomorphus CBS 101889]
MFIKWSKDSLSRLFLHESERIFAFLCGHAAELSIPLEVIPKTVRFNSRSDRIYYPTPFKVTETLAALKGIEGALAAAIADLRFGTECEGRQVTIDLERATLFGFQALIAKVNGCSRSDPGIKKYLKDTDLHAAQSNLYRRLAANMYRTKNENEFFHLHGSLNPSKTLNMIGLASHRSDRIEYDEIIRLIQAHVEQWTAAELEQVNLESKQAGVTVYTYKQFCDTPHGKTSIQEPWWKVCRLQGDTPPTPFAPSTTRRPLAGVKVLELCCVIAGPVIGRILAEYGADVLKITCSSTVPDVPFFQVDGNMGKHVVDIDLKCARGRKKFEELLRDADVIIDGYRPGVLERLGYGPVTLSTIATRRGKGIVYVDENCFGHEGPWSGRPGWQQIVDCLTGFARAFGAFLRQSEPIVSPWPIADYGAGCMGAIAALTGLYNRARYGGSYHCKASLMQFNLLLFAVGQYPTDIQKELRDNLPLAFRNLRYCDGVDRSSKVALDYMQENFPWLFQTPACTSPEDNLMETWYSHHYGAEVEVVGPVARIDAVEVGFVRATRPNGADENASWDFSDSEEDFRCM